MAPLARDDSLLPLTEKWLRWKNTAKPSPHTLKARRNDLAVIAALIADSVGRDAGPSDASLFERELSRLRLSDLTRDAVAEAFALYPHCLDVVPIHLQAGEWIKAVPHDRSHPAVVR